MTKGVSKNKDEQVTFIIAMKSSLTTNSEMTGTLLGQV